jgi:hypothetical protein
METQLKTTMKPASVPPASHVPALIGILQRKCDCGSSTSSLSGECPECLSQKYLQRKLRRGASNDPLEHEADQIADQVLAMPAPLDTSGAFPRIQRYAGRATGQAGPVPASVQRTLASRGNPLHPALRQDMEQRFGHDFSQVRVHSGTAAERSARDVNGHAYTVGSNIVFATGRFSPGTHEGRRLIAHELAHVVQQSGADGVRTGQSNREHGTSAISSPTLIQRQPDEHAAKQDSPKKQPPQKTLKSEGVDLSDPVASGTAAVIDEVLLRNQKLAPYIGDRLNAGFRIAEKGKFVQASTDGNFDDAYRDAYNLDSSTTVPKHTEGFFDSKKSEVHLRPGAKFGTALHEAVHRLASASLYRVFLQEAMKISTNLTEVLKEGVTAFFTDLILKDEGLPNFNDAYRSKKRKAETLIAALGSDGFDLIAKFNFKGTGVIEIGEKLGFTRKQFSDSKGRGTREVLKRMDKVL